MEEPRDSKRGTALATIVKESDSIKDDLASLLTDLPPPDNSGISLLGLKNHILLAYLHHLVSICSLRVQGLSFDDAKPVENSVWLRLALERIRPMQGKLKHQVDKLVAKAQAAEAAGGRLDEDEIINDPLSFRPNLAAFVDPEPSSSRSRRAGSAEAAEDDEDTLPSRTKPEDVYRPPRVAPVPYPDPSSSSKRRTQQAPSALRSEAALAFSSLPHAEASTGLGTAPTGAASASARAKHLARMEQYEEDNFARLFQTKKDAKRRRLDEADVALGGRGVSAADPKGRRKGGLESEFADVLGAIGGKDLVDGGRRRKNKGEDKRKGKEDPYAAIRERGRTAKKPRFDRPGGGGSTFDSAAAGKGRRAPSAFARAVKRSQRGAK